MKKTKRLLSAVLTLCLALTMISGLAVTAAADGDASWRMVTSTVTEADLAYIKTYSDKTEASAALAAANKETGAYILYDKTESGYCAITADGTESNNLSLSSLQLMAAFGAHVYYTDITVAVTPAANGRLDVSSQSAAAGDTVTVTVTPDAGYALEELTAADADDNAVALTPVNDATYTFVMPAGRVTVTAVFAEIIVPVPVFTDVDESAYYYDAVLWAAENRITAGTSDTAFSPDAPCTRAQVVTFLWRYAGSPEPTGTTCSFTDVKAGSYYEKAVLWAVENGITHGTSDTTFSPDGSCTRAQVVTFLARYAGADDAVSSYAHRFLDVLDTYFSAAVAWAVQKAITFGVDTTHFAPYRSCTRAEVVTFLYRYDSLRTAG